MPTDTPTNFRPAPCHADRKYHAKNLCQSCYEKQWYVSHKDRIKTRTRKYRETHREAAYARTREWVKLHPERTKARQREWFLKTYYNMSVADYDKLLALQGGGCAICGCTERLSVDHDHNCCSGLQSCGKCVRGILCKNHNTAFGLLEDNVEDMYKMIAYLVEDGEEKN